jgi:L-fuconolactonase
MSFTYIDAHTHFWDQRTLSYPWLAEMPALGGRHTPDELRQQAGAVSPSQIVFVECGAPWLGEVRWVEALAARESRITGIVARCDMNAGDATTAAIDELRRHPLVRGVRHSVQDEPDPGVFVARDFVAAIRQLGAAGLSFDLCCRHHQLPAIVELCRACPDTRFILDHCGKPGIRAGRLDPWREHIRALAALPNVDCKLSGLITEAEPAAWTIDQLRPYVDQVLWSFGASRVLFGGDWPVVTLAASYPRWLDTARELVSRVPPAGQDAIFTGNARRAYRLP